MGIMGEYIQGLVGGLERVYFSIYWEFHHPNWLSYFSEGLKPPTRKSLSRNFYPQCIWLSNFANILTSNSLTLHCAAQTRLFPMFGWWISHVSWRRYPYFGVESYKISIFFGCFFNPMKSNEIPICWHIMIDHPWRIHGAAIYGAPWIPSIFTPVMLAFFCQHHGSVMAHDTSVYIKK